MHPLSAPPRRCCHQWHSNAVLFDEARNLVVGRETRAVRFCALAFPRDVALVAGLYRATRDGGFRPDPTGDARGAMRLHNIAQREQLVASMKQGLQSSSQGG